MEGRPRSRKLEFLKWVHLALISSCLRVESVNGKKYILVIVDDYSRFTWVKFLRSKDEAPDFIIKFLKMIQVRLKVSQNGVVKRRNHTLIEAARTMLIYAQASLFLWAEVVATACFTQNRSIIRLRHGKTPYELLHNKLPNLTFLHVFGALCYLTNDSENLERTMDTIIEQQVAMDETLVPHAQKETVTLKRRRDDDADKDEEPSAGPDRESKRRREGKEPESASAPSETATRSAGRSTKGSRSRHVSASKSALAEEPVQTTSQMDDPLHPEFNTGADDQPIIQSSQHPKWFPPQQKPPSPDRSWNKTLSAVHGSIQPWISELAKGHVKVWLSSNIIWKKSSKLQQINWTRSTPKESSRDVYSKRRIIAVTKLKIVVWHSYKHLDWITVRRDDDKLYKFKEDDFKRLRIQDIEDMLLLLVQGKLTNLTVKERFAFNVSLWMFTRSIVIQRRVKTFNWNKDKKNRLIRIDELHKFSDGTLTDVRTTLDDRLKGIQMQYLPQTIFRKSDKERAAAMIQAIDKRLKTRRIIRSLERKLGKVPTEMELILEHIQHGISYEVS
nr:hypothetical protein [Tanacetum cinerariifolium]